MIPVDSTQTIESTGTNYVGRVTVTSKTIPFLINAVTDRIYGDKPGAIVREYPTNAWDVHIRYKRPISDIIITLPTIADPVFRIRDFGPGLSTDEIRDIYCILGESTKRNSNDEAGQLGLGCKSGFAYGDSFTVTSWNNGKKSIYNIIKGDDTKEGTVLRLAESDMENTETGIEVAIPIKMHDIYVVHEKAVRFFRHWAVLPTIRRMDESQMARLMAWRNTSPFLSGDGWEIRPKEYGDTSVAIMGPVAYPINWEMLRNKLALTPYRRALFDVFQYNQVVLTFPIGALKFIINREELEYTETTYRSLEDKLDEIFGVVESSIKQKISSASSIWDAKRNYIALFGKNIRYLSDGQDYVPASNVIRMMDGELHHLDSYFTGKLFWNGILIDSPSFEKLHQWDMNHPDGLLETGSPSAPCMVSFRRKNGRSKKLRCTEDANNRIIPHDGVKVVIIDGRNIGMTQTVARYYLLSDSSINKVHVLRFANDDQKAAFFAHYHFDTAEFVYLSQILDDVKAWQTANRKFYGGRTTKLRYLNLDSGDWCEEDVPLRQLEDGGVFVESLHDNAIISGVPKSLYEVQDHLKKLRRHFSEELSRVYFIPTAKLSAKWLQQARIDGLWMELSDFVRQNTEIILTDEIRRGHHYLNFKASRINIINENWLDAIGSELNGECPAFSAFDAARVKNVVNYSDVSHALLFFDAPPLDFGTSDVDYEALMNNIINKYPFLYWMNLTGYDTVVPRKLTDIVACIRAMNT